MSIGKRIKQLRVDRGLGQAVLADKLGIHSNSLRQYENDKRVPDANVIRLLAEIFCVDAAWLIGVDTPKTVDMPTIVAQQVSGLDDRYAYIKKAKTRLSAGGGTEAEEGFESERFGFLKSWLRQKATSTSDEILFLIDVEGDSMLPTFASKDMVLVDKGLAELRSEGYFAIGEGNFINIKRLKREGDAIQIISDNPDKSMYPTRTIDGEGLRIIGRVIWVGREIP